MRRLVVIVAALLATIVGAPSVAVSQTPDETYEQIINDPKLTREHSTVIRLYQAVLGRQPEPEGVRFWLDAFDSDDWTTRRIASFFATSDEFVGTYGDTDNEAFMNAIYTNVLGRSPDPDGGAFWLSQLNDGMERGEMVLLISNASEFIDAYPLPSDIPDFSAITRGTMTLSQTFEVDGELVTSTMIVAFDLAAPQPVTHQWFDASDVIATYGEREAQRLFDEQEQCVAEAAPEETTAGCDRAQGFAFLGANLEPSESFSVGTFAQVRAGEAPGAVTTAGHHGNAINGISTMFERYWPGDGGEGSGQTQLIDPANADLWASIEPHAFVIGVIFDHRNAASVLEQIALTPHAAEPSEGGTVWTARNEQDQPFAGLVELDGWTLVESTVTITTQVEPGALDVPSPLLTRDEMLDLFVNP